MSIDAARFLPFEDFVQVSWDLAAEIGHVESMVLTWIAFRTRVRSSQYTIEADGYTWWRMRMLDLAAETRLSEDKVQRIMKKLVDGDALIAVRHYLNGSKDQTYSYRVNYTDHSADLRDGKAEANDQHHSAELRDGAHSADSRIVDSADLRDVPIEEQEEDISLFEQFWKVYPRKIDKPAAESAWHRAMATGFTPSAIIAATKAFSESTEVVGVEAQYIPKARNWLDRQNWKNEYTPAKKPPTMNTIPVHKPKTWDDYTPEGPVQHG